MKDRKKSFIKVPEIPGGKEAFKKYIQENLKYPEEALNQKIEGIVYVVAEINDSGVVETVWIEKGIGFGCDEEAIRLIKNFHFGSVKNKKIRVKAKRKLRIEFRLPQKTEIKYNFIQKEIPKEKQENKGFSYSISINNNSD